MLLKYNMLLGSATKTVVSLWKIWERESCFLLPPPHSHFSLHNINSTYFVSQAKRQGEIPSVPSALRCMNYKGSWKELAVPLYPQEGNPDTDKPWEAAEELICWAGRMAETLLKEQEKYNTQCVKHLLL